MGRNNTEAAKARPDGRPEQTDNSDASEAKPHDVGLKRPRKHKKTLKNIKHIQKTYRKHKENM